MTRHRLKTLWLTLVLLAAMSLSACSADLPFVNGGTGADSEATADEADASASQQDATADDPNAGDDGTGDEVTDAEDPTADGAGDGSSLFDIDAVLAADPDCPAPVEGDPLIVGYAADLGPLGGFADGPASGVVAHMADLINCSGGLDGRPVEVLVNDVSGEDPVVTRDRTLDLLDNGASALLGPPFPDPAFRILNTTNGNTPVLFTGSTEPAMGNAGKLSFLVAYSDTQGASAAAQFAQSQGWSTAATLSSPGPYFGYHPQVFTAAFQDLGGTVLADYPFIPQEQTEFSAEVADLAANPPDVIYSPMLANQWVAFRAELDAAGLTDVALIGTDAFEATDGYSLAGTDGIYHVTHTDPGEDTRVQTLADSFARANGGLPLASRSMAALGGDALSVIAEAYLQSGSADPAELGQAISGLTQVEGVSGILAYDGTGIPNKPMYVHRVVDGQPTLAAVIGR